MRQGYRLVLVLTALLGIAQTALAAPGGKEFSEGSQYQRIDPPVPLSDHEGRVEVVEMFFYACPHCYELEPKLRKWLQDKPYIDFHQVPAIVGPTWADQARAFYIARQLGKPDELDSALFKAIHEGGEQIYNEYAVFKFFAEQGYDEKRISDLYYSPEVADAVDKARLLTVKYNLRGVPAVVVNGKYVTAPYFVHSQEEMLEVLDSLIEKERAAPKVSAAADVE
jgi:thiol:disulfide interchange protein DsbA